MSDNTSTQEELGLRDYELTVVINPETSEEKLEASIESISRYVTDRGGAVSDVQRWGKRKLAYPIKHQIEGYYVLLQFKMKPPDGKELENNLRISEEVLRHLLISIE
ncbi:MAG: 30S ribosomal protein S6 [Dehalococcoidales bacterium]|nr:MAG: 30S ribosomal protein S6 [Dehalococcoidales bacterium]